MAVATTVTQLVILALTVAIIAAAPFRIQGEEHMIDNCCKLGQSPSGVYVINNYFKSNSLEVAAYCSEGGWLVVQKRKDGSVDFNRTWEEYENGFGSLNTEFWYGLKSLNCLTSKGNWEMIIDLVLTNGTAVSLHYRTFKVGPAEDMYKLTIGGFQGTSNDPMAYHNGRRFTTKDVDNDKLLYSNCALYRDPLKPTGGWWYGRCWLINPNMILEDNTSGVFFNNNWYGFKSVQMKIRPQDCAV